MAIRTIAEICLATDNSRTTPTWTESGVAVVRSKNIKNGRLDLTTQPSYTDEESFAKRTKNVVPRADDVIITREAPMGEICMIPPGLRCCMGQRMVLLRPDPDVILPEYLLYSLLAPQARRQIGIHEGAGSTVSNLRVPMILGLKLNVPSLTEQKRAVAVLTALDAKIDLNRRLNERLEAWARAIFEEAETSGGPKRWRRAPLAEVAHLNPPRRIKKGTIAPYVEMSSLPTTGHRANEWPGREVGSGTRFENGDTLFARITPCLENGKTGYVDFLEDGEVGWGSTEYIVIRPLEPLPPEWGYLLARDVAFREFAVNKMDGTTGRQRVSAEALGRYVVAVPSPDFALTFGRIVKSVFRRMAASCDENRLLTGLRNYLLPRLFSGEIRPLETAKLAESAK